MNKYEKAATFLGGTCNGSQWRDKLIARFDPAVNYFNPVVADWTPECQAEEERQKLTAEFFLYVITPKMVGVYSIAELVHDSLEKSGRTLFCILEQDEDAVFSKAQMKSLEATAKMCTLHGARRFETVGDVADYLNKIYTEK